MRCIGIIIREDQEIEANESFLVLLEGIGRTMQTEVIVSDDDGIHNNIHT